MRNQLVSYVRIDSILSIISVLLNGSFFSFLKPELFVMEWSELPISRFKSVPPMDKWLLLSGLQPLH